MPKNSLNSNWSTILREDSQLRVGSGSSCKIGGQIKKENLAIILYFSAITSRPPSDTILLGAAGNITTQDLWTLANAVLTKVNYN